MRAMRPIVHIRVLVEIDEVGLKRGGDHVLRLLQLLDRARAVVQPHGHSHSLENLDVVVDLKRLREIKVVLGPVAGESSLQLNVALTYPVSFGT